MGRCKGVDVLVAVVSERRCDVGAVRTTRRLLPAVEGKEPEAGPEPKAEEACWRALENDLWVFMAVLTVSSACTENASQKRKQTMGGGNATATVRQPRGQGFGGRRSIGFVIFVAPSVIAIAIAPC